jgi:hypothetical protein
LSNNPNYKATFLILNDIEKHDLIQFTKEHFDESYFRNFLDFQKAFTFSFAEIIKKLDPLDKKYEYLSMFVIYSESSYIISHLNMMKIFLKIIINTSKIKGEFNDCSLLSALIKKICNKMQYSEKLKNSVLGLFLEQFQTAIISGQYIISKNGYLIIYPNDKQLMQHISIETLCDYSLQVMAIFDAMTDWSNGKKKSVKKKTSSFDELIHDFKKQVEILDEKLNNLT